MTLTKRESHYGAGRQPWDDIVDAGWGPAFAAGNVLKYLRRNKDDPAGDLEKARWYWGQLRENVRNASFEYAEPWLHALSRLCMILSPEEKGRL